MANFVQNEQNITDAFVALKMGSVSICMECHTFFYPNWPTFKQEKSNRALLQSPNSKNNESEEHTVKIKKWAKISFHRYQYLKQRLKNRHVNS